MFRYFFWTTFFLILSGGVFVFTLTQLDPLGPQSIVALSLFFTSLLGFAWTVCAYLFFFGAELFAGRNLANNNFAVALRRGFLVSLLSISLLGLRLFNLLGWTEAVLLATFLLLVELIFSTKSATLPAK